MLFAQRPLIEDTARKEAKDDEEFTIIPLHKSQQDLSDVERFHVRKMYNS